jgi:hypothetical protein
MTYTFKLARRLAVSRRFVMLPVLLLFAACSGDAVAPDNSPANPATETQGSKTRDVTPVAVRINPNTVTLETNQLIHFWAHGRNKAGDSVGAPVTWSATGGTILPDGRFAAATIGTYQVLGRARALGDVLVDSATVVVVRRQPQLGSLEVTPPSATLTPGVSQTFSAIGRLRDGNTVVIGVNWTTSGGGSIDAGGTYVAGDTAGTYQVIGMNTAGTIADTASVTISAPPPPPGTDSTPPPPAPALVKVKLVPGAATLAPGTHFQFTAYGQTAAGDSVAVGKVTFNAAGGTVDPTGLYTAGTSAGKFRLVAASGSLADTSIITVSNPLGSGGAVGRPFGIFNLYGGGPVGPMSWDTPMSAPAALTLSTDFLAPEGVLLRIASAREHKLKLLTSMTGGSHTKYKTDGVFDMAKWKAAMDMYNTPTIKAAIASAVADGTIIGNSVMDEPHNTDLGFGDRENTWGPRGTMTKARVDEMCAYVKNIFPTLPAGVFHQHAVFEPDKSYRVCDFIVDQYGWTSTAGDIAKFRDAALAMARRDGHEVMFSLNILNGGEQKWPKDPWVCPVAPESFGSLPPDDIHYRRGGGSTGGFGTFPPTCRMTADQVRDWGKVLGSAGCALTMWRYDATFLFKPDNAQALKDVATHLATLPARPCRRT